MKKSEKKNDSIYWEKDNISPVVAELVNSLNSLQEDKKKTEESLVFKNSLLMSLGNELRMPLIRILGFSEILQNEIFDSWHLGMIKDINLQGKKLLHTLSLVIRLSQIESGTLKFDFQKIRINDLINNVYQYFLLKAKEKGLSFEKILTNNDLYVYADLSVLREILNNVFDNAIKNTEKGYVKISLEKIMFEEKSFVSIEVLDTGIGIEEKNKKNIFKDISVLKRNVSYETENSGLGLSISEYMANRMGGNIELTSTVGSGSAFRINIPEYIPEDSKVNEIFIKTKDTLFNADTKLYNILLVEDNISNINIVEIFLKGLYKVMSVTTGEAALKIATNKSFDAVIMDINLGSGINGITTSKALRNLEGYDKIPILAVTGYALAGDKDVLLNKGFNGYMAKPFTKQQLISLIKQFLR